MRTASVSASLVTVPPGQVRITQSVAADEWDAFVNTHPEATAYHLWPWRRVFETAFHHECIYLAARRDRQVTGVLPLVRFQNWMFGRFLVSLPFVNYGGVLARDGDSAAALLQHAADLAGDLGSSHVEFRHRGRMFPALADRQHKVAMLLPLPTDIDTLWQRLDRKVRNQIRKAEKSGLTSEVAGAELLGDFYAVFARNMRDLGTPVYSRRFFSEVFTACGDRARICVVKLDGRTVAAGLSLRYRDTIEVPWASALRSHRPLCPNHMLYWTLISTAVREKCQIFDFGRSTPDEGTFQFKRQWGAEPHPLHWEYHLEGGRAIPDQSPKNPRFRTAIALWKRLPLGLTMRVGPSIVRCIP